MTVTGASRIVESQDGTPVENAVPVRFVIPATTPAEFVTHIWVHDFGPGHGAYEVTLHRVETPARLPGDPPLTEVQATCVARVVLSDGTMKAMLQLLSRVAGPRIKVELVDLNDQGPETKAEAEP